MGNPTGYRLSVGPLESSMTSGSLSCEGAGRPALSAGSAFKRVCIVLRLSSQGNEQSRRWQSGIKTTTRVMVILVGT